MADLPKTVLLPLLADGECRSGQLLADTLGVSRTAIWKQLNKLESLGLEIESVKGQGYRIPGGLDLLSEPAIIAALQPQASSLLSRLDIFETIDSTNAEALRCVAQGAGSGRVITAEQQTAGRGRRGREWVSPFARNIYLSLVWEFSQGAAALEGLSLAVGVGVARALACCGLSEVQLKWPNDILHDRAKLGGVLLEMTGDAAGNCQLVLGVGLNVAMPMATASAIDQSWTDLVSATGGNSPGRNLLLAELLNELLPLVAGFESRGFGEWQQQWQALDAFANQAVILTTGEKQLAGMAQGVDDRGALLLKTGQGVQAIYGGEISLRPAG